MWMMFDDCDGMMKTSLRGEMGHDFRGVEIVVNYYSFVKRQRLLASYDGSRLCR